MPSDVDYPALIFLSLWAGLGIVYDGRSRRLPNGLTLGGLAAGLGYLAVAGEGMTGASWQSCLLAGAAGLALMLLAYALKAVGAGDVKFTAAMGVLGGGAVLVTTLVLGSLLLAAMALWSLIAGGRFPLLSAVLYRIGIRPVAMASWKPRRHLPFGVAHGIAFIAAIWSGWTLF